MMPQRTFLMMLIVICVTILCFVWMVRDSLCGLRLQQGNTVLVATLAYEVKRYLASAAFLESIGNFFYAPHLKARVEFFTPLF